MGEQDFCKEVLSLYDTIKDWSPNQLIQLVKYAASLVSEKGRVSIPMAGDMPSVERRLVAALTGGDTPAKRIFTRTRSLLVERELNGDVPVWIRNDLYHLRRSTVTMDLRGTMDSTRSSVPESLDHPEQVITYLCNVCFLDPFSRDTLTADQERLVMEYLRRFGPDNAAIDDLPDEYYKADHKE